MNPLLDEPAARSGDDTVTVPLPIGALRRADSQSIQVAAPAHRLRVLHVVEALRGGPASYLLETLPEQEAVLGAQNLTLLIPKDQAGELPGHRHISTVFFMNRRPRPLNIPALIVSIRAWLRDNHADIIHAQGTLAGVAVRLAIRGMASKPKVVYCAHGWAFDREASSWKNVLAARIERFLARWADSIVCISDHDYESGLRAGLPPRRLLTISNGIADLPPSAAEHSAHPVHWPPGKRRFLFVGRFDRQKGADLFLHAMRLLGDDSFGYAVGSPAVGKEEPLDVPPNVKLTGWLPRDQVQNYIASAEVLVMPSRWEGFGLTALEAMRAGKPVIAARVGGLAEIVAHNVTGLLVKPNDPSGLAEAMRSLTDAQIRTMSLAARKRFLDRYQADRMNASTVSLYRRLTTR